MNEYPPGLERPTGTKAPPPSQHQRDRREELGRLLGGIDFDPDLGVHWDSLHEGCDEFPHAVAS